MYPKADRIKLCQLGCVAPRSKPPKQQSDNSILVPGHLHTTKPSPLLQTMESCAIDAVFTGVKLQPVVKIINNYAPKFTLSAGRMLRENGFVSSSRLNQNGVSSCVSVQRCLVNKAKVALEQNSQPR